VPRGLNVQAIRFAQNGRVFYLTAVRAGDLINRQKVDEWRADDPEDETGYQRAPSPSRLREVANYIQRDDGILPTGGLMNARAPNGSAYGQMLHFEPFDGEEGAIQAGLLTVPDQVLPLWTVDMQHRIFGVKLAIEADQRADLTDFPLVVTIADGLAKLEEVEQFDIINTTQKKVRTDLARRTMAIRAKDPGRKLEFDRRGKLWEARGPVVVDYLRRESVVWKEQILPPNQTKKEMPRAIVRETSFVTSLKPILQTPLFVRMNEEQIAILIDRYWQALRMLFEGAFDYPEEYVIQKTPGVFSLHALFPEIVEAIRSKGQLSIENIYEVISPWSELGAAFWERDNEDGPAKYGSMKGFSRLAAELRALCPALQPADLAEELL
jgi:DGQHR domain-containing protein